MKSWPIGKKVCKRNRARRTDTKRAGKDSVWLSQSRGLKRGGKEKRNTTNTGAMGNQTTQDFNDSSICFLTSKESGYGLYHLLPRCGLTNKWTDVTPCSCKGEALSSFCPLPVSSPHPWACSAVPQLPAEAMRVPNLQPVSPMGSSKNAKNTKAQRRQMVESVPERRGRRRECEFPFPAELSGSLLLPQKKPWSAVVWHLWHLALRISSWFSFQPEH